MRQGRLVQTGLLICCLLLISTAATAAIDNVTIRLSHGVDGETYIDGDQRPAGNYTADELSFPYVVTETIGPELVTGLVSTGGLVRLGYAESGSTVTTHLTQEYRNGSGTSRVLMPFAAATHAAVDNREGSIQGGLFGPGGFFTYANPSFAYDVVRTKIIRATITTDPVGIDLLGANETLSSGTHRVAVQNRGTDANGTLQVRVNAR